MCSCVHYVLYMSPHRNNWVAIWMVLNTKLNSECRNGRIIPRNENQVILEPVTIKAHEEVAVWGVEDPTSDEAFGDQGQEVSFENFNYQ